MYDFNYHRPDTLDEAVALFEGADDPAWIAGGQTLLPTMKQRLASPSDLIDLGAVRNLAGISVTGDVVTIGALTPHADVAGSADVAALIPALADMAETIGDRQVRNRGTLGGSIANNDPAADYPAALLALDATVLTSRREITADDFFTGMFETALDPGEIVTAVRFPKPQLAAYAKFDHPASRYALVGVFVAKTAKGVRLAVTGAAPAVFRVPEMESALDRDFSNEAIADLSVAQDSLNADLFGGADYRAHLVGVMARWAVAAAARG